MADPTTFRSPQNQERNKTKNKEIRRHLFYTCIPIIKFHALNLGLDYTFGLGEAQPQPNMGLLCMLLISINELKIAIQKVTLHFPPFT